MKKLLLAMLVAMLGLLGCSTPTMGTMQNSVAEGGRSVGSGGFTIVSGKLTDANGKVFVIQGINHAHAWFKSTSNTVIPQVRGKNANTVRTVVSNGTNSGVGGKDSLATLNQLIQLAKDQKLINVLEVHDTTGFQENGGATSLDQAANYWVEMKSALVGQEKYVLVNIGNEPYGNNNTGTWATDTKNAIAKMRAAGIHNTIVVDAPNWGQDWSGTMKANAATIFDLDPDKNILFSVHMYESYPDAKSVDSYLQAYLSAGLPLIVGEFATGHGGKPVDAVSILALSKSKANGYIGWSWTGNSGEVNAADLDLVRNGNPNDPTPWGTLLFNDLRTAQVCSVFVGATPSPTPTPTAPPSETPYSAVYDLSRPVTIPAADFNNGGESIGYHDTDAVNSGGAYRQTGVDLESSSEGGFNIGWTQPGEWVDYFLRSPSAQLYDFELRVAAPAAGARLHLELDGVNLSGSLSVPASGGWQTYTTIKAVRIPLNAGQSKLRVVFDAAGTNLASIRVSLSPDATPSPTPTPTATPTPTPTPPSGFTVSYTKNDWGNGFTAQIVIKNNGSVAVDGWKLTFNFAGNQVVTNSWSSLLTQRGTLIQALNADYNRSIPAGGSVSLGFNANYSGTNLDPTNFAVLKN